MSVSTTTSDTDDTTKEQKKEQNSKTALNTVNKYRASEVYILADRNDWQLHPAVFAKLNSGRWGGPRGHTIDLFATDCNKLVSRYCTLDPTDADAICRNAFRWTWTDENCWANPPWEVIPQVLAKVSAEAATMTLIAPVWKDALWYQHLLGMLVDFPVLLEHSRELFAREGRRADKSGIYGPPPWPYTAAWRISGDSARRRHFTSVLRRKWSTQASGPRTLTQLPPDDQYAGVTEGMRIPFAAILTIEPPAPAPLPLKRGEAGEEVYVLQGGNNVRVAPTDPKRGDRKPPKKPEPREGMQEDWRPRGADTYQSTGTTSRECCLTPSREAG